MKKRKLEILLYRPLKKGPKTYMRGKCFGDVIKHLL